MAYLKVWRGGNERIPAEHLFIKVFEAGNSESEGGVYLEAAEVMRRNPGAKWAVSVPCSKLCAGLPVLWNRVDDGDHRPFTGLMVEALWRVDKARGGYRSGAGSDAVLRYELAPLGLVQEVAPSTWIATERGKARAAMNAGYRSDVAAE